MMLLKRGDDRSSSGCSETGPAGSTSTVPSKAPRTMHSLAGAVRMIRLLSPWALRSRSIDFAIVGRRMSQSISSTRSMRESE